jgi:hypothetical protein
MNYIIASEDTNIRINSLETHLCEMDVSTNNRYKYLTSQVIDIKDSHIKIICDLNAITANVESIERAKLDLDYRTSIVKNKIFLFCQDIATGWKHVKDHDARLALLQEEVTKLKDDLNEFKTHTEVEVNADVMQLQRWILLLLVILVGFYPLIFFLFHESWKTKSFLFNR